MHICFKQTIASVMSGLALGAVMLTTGCAEHRYRTYDPYYNDYHRWNGGEEAYYRRFNTERHYDYVEYNKLNKERQREYWDWRHKQGEHHGDHRDRDHDHDHDRR